MDRGIAVRSYHLRARRARERAVILCGDARSLRSASEHVTAAILFELECSPAPSGADARGRPQFVLRLVRLPLCVGFARRELGRWLARVGVDGAVARDICLAFTEACANAVEHPVAPTRQLFEVFGSATSDNVAVGVRDYGGWSEPVQNEERGRGLALIRSLMDGVEVERSTSGTSVRMWKTRRGLRPPQSPSSQVRRSPVSSMITPTIAPS
jgi:anti-sigma regulatory factor (Ser/Thr protein kinase)